MMTFFVGLAFGLRWSNRKKGGLKNLENTGDGTRSANSMPRSVGTPARSASWVPCSADFQDGCGDGFPGRLSESG